MSRRRLRKVWRPRARVSSVECLQRGRIERREATEKRLVIASHRGQCAQLCSMAADSSGKDHRRRRASSASDDSSIRSYAAR
jgi:hypothetical protein